MVYEGDNDTHHIWNPWTNLESPCKKTGCENWNSEENLRLSKTTALPKLTRIRGAEKNAVTQTSVKITGYIGVKTHEEIIIIIIIIIIMIAP